MGYACPVCSEPQRDAEHLAHHLAFTAMLHGDDHESWLDAHVSTWASHEPATLADAVAEFAEETEYEEVFEDTRPVESHDHDHAHDHPHAGGGSGDVDPETRRVLEEARDLTRRMLDDDGKA